MDTREIQTLETARLLVRPFQEQDYFDLYEYLSNPIVYRFEPGEPVSLERAKELAVERAAGSDFWAVVLKSARKMVGHLYFAQIEPKEWLTWELGYIFNPAYQNNGYASESALALVRHGFQHFGIHRVMAHCSPENIPSWKVLEKIGMRREGHFRKNIFFHTSAGNANGIAASYAAGNAAGSPLWLDTYAYALLKEDLDL